MGQIHLVPRQQAWALLPILKLCRFPPPRHLIRRPRLDSDADREGPYIGAPNLKADTFEPFAFLRERFGFIPNVFRAQSLRPDVIEAEVEAIRVLLLTDDHLTPTAKGTNPPGGFGGESEYLFRGCPF